MLILRGHTAPIRGLAYSPDGRLLASASEDKTVRLWELSTGRQYAVLTGHTDVVRAVVFAPDGNQIASAGWDHHLRFWSVRAPRPLREYSYAGAGIYALAFSSDGTTVALGDGRGVVRLHYRKHTVQPMIINGHNYPVLSVAFTADGKTLASASQDRTVRLWQSDWGQQIGNLSHPDWVRALAFSPNGGMLATGCDDGLVRFLDLGQSKKKPAQQLSGHNGPICQLVFTRDGREMISGSWDGTVRIWNPATGRATAAFDWGIGRVHCLAVSPEGLTAAAAGADHAVVVWDLDN